MVKQECETVVLSNAAMISIQIKIEEEEKTESFDAYSLLELIEQGEGDHGDDGGYDKLNLLRGVVASVFSVQPEKIAINQLLDLRELVVSITNRLYDERKKKISSTVSSPVSTPEFPIVSPSGQSGKSNSGSTTPLPSNSGGQKSSQQQPVLPS